VREDELVAAIAKLVGEAPARVSVSIGDDAAAWQPSRSQRSVITTDALIENVHFTREWISMHDIGLRSMTANLSDVAAMGARPVLATVALGIPPDLSQDLFLELYGGMADQAAREGVAIVGGDLTRSSELVISITVVGEVRASNLKQRSGARAGDVLAVTGPLGASRAGFSHLRGDVRLKGSVLDQALRAFRAPVPRCAEGRFLGASRSVHAMMDCSDGLSTDVARLARASGVGVRIDDVPVADSATLAARAMGVSPEEFALAGGEDFELLLAIAPRAFAHLSGRFAARFGRSLLRVGTAEADERLVVVKGGAQEALVRSGYDHFMTIS